MNDVLVTVICVAYNQEKYIRKTLNGLVCQKTHFKYEVLVHDDASSDNTPEIIREYERKFPEIIVPILQKENQFSRGVKFTKDLLIPMAKGKYIAFCEGDDYWTDPDKLQLQYEAMEQHPECSICVHRVQGISEDETKNIRTFPRDMLISGKISASDVLHRMLVENEWVFHTSSYFFRKKDAIEMNEKAYRFWTHPAYGDYSYIQMAALKGDFFYIDRIMSIYRMGAVGSVVRRDTNIMLRKERNKRFIEAISDFDSVSERIFHKDVQIAINRFTFALAELDKDYEVIFSPEMRRFWNELACHVKVRIIVSKWCPWIDKVYYKLRKKVKGV